MKLVLIFFQNASDVIKFQNPTPSACSFIKFMERFGISDLSESSCIICVMLLRFFF